MSHMYRDGIAREDQGMNNHCHKGIAKVSLNLIMHGHFLFLKIMGNLMLRTLVYLVVHFWMYTCMHALRHTRFHLCLTQIFTHEIDVDARFKYIQWLWIPFSHMSSQTSRLSLLKSWRARQLVILQPKQTQFMYIWLDSPGRAPRFGVGASWRSWGWGLGWGQWKPDPGSGGPRIRVCPG